MRETKYTDIAQTKERKKFIWLSTFLIILTIISLCLSSFILAATKQNMGSHVHVHYEPPIADYLDYFTNPDGTLTTTGFKNELDKYPTRIKIPSEYNGNVVTAIDEYAFCGYAPGWNLVSVIMPDTILTIGEAAFMDCSELTSINISNSLTYIDRYAFSNCSGLTSITIPGSVKYIREEAFRGCSGLTSITFQSGVENIDYDAFFNCTGLKEVTIDSIYVYNDATRPQDCGELLQNIDTQGETVKVLKSIVDDAANTNNYLNNNPTVFTRTTSADGKYYIYTHV